MVKVKLETRGKMAKKIFLTLISAVGALFFWYFVGEKAILKDDSNSFSKLQCVSYAPFGKDDSPFMMTFSVVHESGNLTVSQSFDAIVLSHLAK